MNVLDPGNALPVGLELGLMMFSLLVIWLLIFRLLVLVVVV